MARIGAEELEQLKRNVDLAALVRGSGVDLEPRGRDLVGRCPLPGHEDDTPSLVISPDKNLWHCMGACDVGGSVIDWVMKTQRVSFRHAVEVLRRSARHPEGPVAAAPAPVLARDAADAELLDQVVQHYRRNLEETPAAQAYLQKRGIAHPEFVQKFQVGFANRTLGYLMPKNREGLVLRGRLQQLGVIRESGHEHFNGCVTFPITDDNGRVLGMYGRKITPGLHANLAHHLYMKGRHEGVWNGEVFQASKEVILCESIIDAATFWCAGFRNVTCSYGVNGFTSEHLALLRKHATQKLLIAYDRDDAGHVAAEKLAEQLKGEPVQCFKVLFPHGMDANEYALKTSSPQKALEFVVRSAGWMGGVGVVPEVVLETAAAEEEEEAPAPVTSVPQVVEVVDAAEAADAADTDAANTDVVVDTTVLVPPATEEPKTQRRGDELVMMFGDRRYRVRGFEKNTAFEVMKVNLMVSRGEAFHVDSLDLYAARFRAMFLKVSAHEIGVEEEVVKKDVGKVLGKLEELQEERRKAAASPAEKVVEMSDAEKDTALQFLRDPKLVENILSDFETCGVVGEEVNKLVGYLAAVSRKLPDPLAIMVQSSSAAGKSSLMEAVLAFMPEEEQQKYSAMTGQSLYYMGETNLRHKILALVEEEGAERASYALKLLQSEGELTIASTGKDNAGRLETKDYRVEGPVMIFLTTTAVDLDEELLNRCIMLTVDESREQTRAIHRMQRQQETEAGMWQAEEKAELRVLHRNAQRLLQPINVRNPFCRELTFLDDKTRMRRDHKKYLILIRAIALLHQYQRPVKTAVLRGRQKQFIEVTLSDIALANVLAAQVLGRSLDELAPQTRRMLIIIHELVVKESSRLKLSKEDYRFSRRLVREFSGWGETQVRTHIEKLVEMEYLLVHRGGRGQSFVYELVYDGQGQDGAPFMMGLADVGQLAGKYGVNFAGDWSQLAGGSRPVRGGNAPGSQGFAEAETPHSTGSNAGHGDDSQKNAQGGVEVKIGPYVNGKGRRPPEEV